MKRILFLLALLPLASCQRDTITSIWVPKEETITAASSHQSTGRSGISWHLPEGWIEQAPADMRVGSFIAKAANGQEVDISIVPLTGMAGGMLANINRWRGQIQLPSLEETDLDGQTKKITLGNRPMTYVDFSSADPLIEGKYKKRIIAAIYEHQGKTWFFKMTGEEEAIGSVEAGFKKFLSDLHFDE